MADLGDDTKLSRHDLGVLDSALNQLAGQTTSEKTVDKPRPTLPKKRPQPIGSGRSLDIVTRPSAQPPITHLKTIPSGTPPAAESTTSASSLEQPNLGPVETLKEASEPSTEVVEPEASQGSTLPAVTDISSQDTALRAAAIPVTNDLQKPTVFDTNHYHPPLPQPHSNKTARRLLWMLLAAMITLGSVGLVALFLS